MKNEILKTMHKALDDKFGMDIVILDISEISDWADYFIIATGNNKSQIQAMTDELIKKSGEHGISPAHIEGYNNSAWVLLDFGDIIIHIFDKENRSFYNLERIWMDARKINV